MSEFENYLSRTSAEFGEYLVSTLPHGIHPDMQQYLYGPLEEYLRNAGKRHRPLICVLACEAVGGDGRLAWSSAAAIEHFHTGAIIHDDIADSSLTRRGLPTMHIQQGDAIAINAGDLAISLVTGLVTDDEALSAETRIRVLKEMVRMTARTIEGQALDIGWARDDRFDLTIDDYLIMAEHKTAFYSGGMPLAIGAIIGGGTDEQVEVLRSFGQAIGLAFQVQDDILNLVGSEAATGKDFRNDITEGKRTLAVVHALKHSAERDRLLEILASRSGAAAVNDEAVDIMTASGSIDFARQYARDLVVEAKTALQAALPQTPALGLLLSLADYLIERDR